MRTIGAALLFFACAAAGYLRAAALSRRVGAIERAVGFIDAVFSEMRHSRAEIPEILRKLEGSFGVSGGEWRGYEGLFSEERAVMDSFCSRLGKSDIEGELNSCLTHKETLSRILASARAERESRARLYRSLGVLSGLFLAILFV